MNLNGFHSRPFMVPVNPHHNFAYFSPLPVMPISYHMPPLPNWNITPFHIDPRHALYRHFTMQQQLGLSNSPSLAMCRTITNENMSTCTISDDDHQIGEKQEYQEDPLVKTENDTYDNSVEEGTEKDRIREKLEAFSESSPDFRHKRFNIPTKVEYKLEDDNSIEAKLEHGWQIKREAYDDRQEAWEGDINLIDSSRTTLNLEGSQKLTLKVELKQMIDFIIEHFGRIRESDLAKERIKYQDDPILSKVFDILLAKYSCTFKTRAEIVKYITRKAFSTIKNNSKKESDANSKEACKALCKRYFQVSSEEIQNSGVDIENRERFLQLLFPYQKNSKNKLQDMELISKLMSSKEFYEDYCLYIQDLGSILEADNNRKLNKFIGFILTCIQKGQLEAIMKYKRVPWLKAWLDNTRLVARELAFSIQWKGQQVGTKKVKNEH